MHINVYSVVITNSDLHNVEAYLYSHTTVARSCVGPVSKRTYVILRTSVDFEAGGFDHAKDEAHRLAHYQCERLQSGLHFALVAGTDSQAIHVLAQQLSQGDVGQLEWVNHDAPVTA